MPKAFDSISRREWLAVTVLTVAFVAMLALPYVLAYRVPSQQVFAGILVNRADGQSYLAKMQEGWRGSWLFTLPYTADPGPGVVVYEPYLFLGHLARWAGASIELVLHLARAATSSFMLLSAYHFIARFFDNVRARLGLWALFALGSGLGWLAVPLGAFTSDLWVAEAFPFLSAFASAHFCLAIGLMLRVFEWTLPGLAGRTPGNLIRIALAVTLIAQTQPLALLVIAPVLGLLFVIPSGAPQRIAARDWPPVLVVGLFSIPWLAYDVALTLTHPQIAAWSAQNLTPSPPWWDALISGGAPLLLALPGLIVALRRRSALDLIPVVWLAVAVAALVTPFSLQRRLVIGAWMPLVLLAGIGLRDALWPRLAARWRPALLAGIMALTVPSNLLVYAAAFAGIRDRDPRIFLSRDEADGMAWLKAHGQTDDIVLASPDTGLFIPARTGLRVIYGHPFETVEAEAQRTAVERFFQGSTEARSFLSAQRVDFIFYGPRERILGVLPELPGWRPVFGQGEVIIYGR